MLLLKQSTAVVLSFGPALDKTDGVTLVTSLVSGLDHASTGIMLAKNGGTLTIRHATVTATTYDSRGNYKVTLDTTDTNTLGTLRVQYADAATVCPIWEDRLVVPAEIYDWFAGTAGFTSAMFALNTGLRPVRSATAQAGAASTITLDASASAVDDFYNYNLVQITSGTGVGQTRVISDYVGSTKVATVALAWATNPDNTSVFNILTSAAIASSTPPTAAENGTATWAALRAANTTAGSFGEGVKVAPSGIPVGAFVASSITAAAMAPDTGLKPHRSATAQAAAAGTITLDSGASAVDDFYKYQLVKIESGTGASQSRVITAYVGSTKVATISQNWATTPDNTSVFTILGSGVLAATDIDALLDAVIPDSIPADGTAPSIRQGIYMLTQFMLERNVSSTTCTVRKPNGSTTLFTLTLDSASAPTSITRAT